MNNSDIQEIILSAVMIVCGYAFSIMDDGNIRIVGLNAPHHASVLRSTDGEILETNMDDVELAIVEAMHVHASDRRLTEAGSAKFFVKGNGDTVIKERGVLNDKQLRVIQEFIKDNYKEMYLKWSQMSDQGFYGE